MRPELPYGISDQSQTLQEWKLRPTSLININPKIFNKIVGNYIKQCTKRITMTKWDFAQVSKADSTFESQCDPSHKQAEEEKSHDHINRRKKSIWQNSTYVMRKTRNWWEITQGDTEHLQVFYC